MAESVPYSVSLHPDQARQLAINGAALLLLDVPLGTLLGIDQQVFVVGPRFKGVKMIPPGVHFLSYQATSQEGHVSPAVSTFLSLKQRDVVVRKWNAAEEGLEPLEDEQQAARYAEGVRRFDFDSGLAPYDLATCAVWRELSRFIDDGVLNKLLPVGGEISVMAEALDPDLLQPRTEAERRLVQQLQEGHARQHQGRHWQQRAAEQAASMDTDLSGAPRVAACAQTQQVGQGRPSDAQEAAPAAGHKPKWGRCFYTRLPRLVKPPGAQGAALSALNLDKTAVLEQLVAESGDPAGGGLLGELQFSYAAFLFGQSLEGFLQWKALLGLMLSCEQGALHTQTRLFVAFLAVVRQQLAFGLRQTRQQLAGDNPAGSRTGSDDGDDAEDEGGVEGVFGGSCPLGIPLVEELLPDSFLRRQFGAFFEVLHDAGGQVPAPLMQQASQLEALLRDRLGWDYRVKELGGGKGGVALDTTDDYVDDEDQPVVVELTDDEKRMAGLEL